MRTTERRLIGRTMRATAMMAVIVVGAGCTGRLSGAESSGAPADGAASPPSGSQVAGQPELLSKEPWPVAEFWLQVSPGGVALEVYGSLDDLAREADAVVVGRAIDIDFGREIPGDSSGSAFGTLTIEVVDAIIGELADGTAIKVEFFMSDARLYPRFAARLPAERVILFLRNKGLEAQRLGQDPSGPLAGFDYYRVVGPQGYLRDSNGLVEPPIDAADPWLAGLRGSSFDGMMVLLRQATNQ